MFGLSELILLASLFSYSASAADLIKGGVEVASDDPIASSTVFIETSSGDFTCSGSIIEEGIGVAAAHCFKDERISMQVGFGLDRSNAKSVRLRVVASEFNSLYTAYPPSGQSAHDIAVFRFEGQMPNGFHKAEIAPESFQPSTGDSAYLAGYGTNTDIVSLQGFGILRKIEAKFKEIREDEVIFDQTEGGACAGDSGGPAFIRDTVSAKIQLFGVASRVDRGSCLGVGFYTRINSYRDWIAAKIKKLRTGRTF